MVARSSRRRPQRYPPTPRNDVVDIVHGTPISDPYRWLEDGTARDVQAWIAAQNALTRRTLDAVPARRHIRQRLRDLLAIGTLTAPLIRKERYFYLWRAGIQDQPVLLYREGADGASRVLLDPIHDTGDETAALDWWYPSPDGTLLAYGISLGGTEKSTLSVRVVSSGADLGDRIPHTRLASLAWLPDSSGFYYTRYPEPGTVSADEDLYWQRVFFHVLGTSWRSDPEIFGRGRAREDRMRLEASPDGRWLCVSAWDWAKSELYLLDRQAESRGFAVLVEGVEAVFHPLLQNERAYIRTNLAAPNYRILSVDPERPRPAEWAEVVTEQADVLESFGVTNRYVVCHYLHNASSALRLYDLGGHVVRDVTLPCIGSVSDWSTEPDRDNIFLAFASFTTPPAVYPYETTTGIYRLWEAVDTALDTSAFETRQVSFASKDGTRISMFLVHRRGLVADGRRPTVLYGYGGFNVSMIPAFSRSIYLLLEHDGIFAFPNLRGGGEYGEAWHEAGMRTRKQNVFDDCIAAAEYLIREGYTTPRRLAIQGASNGGLLVGAVVMQRPDLFRAAVCQVPLLDMLRYHLVSPGRFWMSEFGSIDDAEEFRALYAYSPYHRVRDGAPYPAILITTAESDTRVNPFHARKFAARLQAAGSGGPVLLYTERRAGHGAGKPLSKLIDETTDVWCFLFRELGMANGTRCRRRSAP